MTAKDSSGSLHRSRKKAAPATQPRKPRFGLTVIAVAALIFGAAGSFLAAHLISGPSPAVVVPASPADTRRPGPESESELEPEQVNTLTPGASHMLAHGGTAEKASAGAAEGEPGAGAPAENTEAPFALDEIAAALSTVDTDDAGNLIVNAAVRDSLEAAFNAPAGPLSEAQVEDLQAMARAGLEGEAGEQAAAIVVRYYRYNVAYREVADTLEHQGNLDAARSNFEQLSVIRRAHLGEELAQQLFGEEEARTRYTLESMRIEAKANLTRDEKARQQEALRQRAPDWLVSRRSGAAPGPSAQTPR